MTSSHAPVDPQAQGVSWSTARFYWFISPLFILNAALFATLTLFSQNSEQTVALIFVASMFLTVLRMAARSYGAYSANSAGISFRPLIGPQRHIPWPDVNRLLWRRHGATFKSGRRRIALNWRQIPSHLQPQLKELLHESLNGPFDLSLQSQPATTRITPRGLLRILIFATTFIALFVLPPYFVLLHNPNAGPLWRVILFAPLTLLYALAVILAIRQAHRHPQTAGWRQRQ